MLLSMIESNCAVAVSVIFVGCDSVIVAVGDSVVVVVNTLRIG